MKKMLVLGALLLAGHSAAFAAVPGENTPSAKFRAPTAAMLGTVIHSSAEATTTQKPAFKVMLASAGMHAK